MKQPPFLPIPSDREAAEWLLGRLAQLPVAFGEAEHAVAVKRWLRAKIDAPEQSEAV